MNKYLIGILLLYSIVFVGCMNDLNPEGGWSDPIVADNDLIVASKDGYLHQFNLETGYYNDIWKYPRGDESLGAIYGSTILFDDTLYGNSYSCRGNDCSGKVFAVKKSDAIPEWGNQNISINSRLIGDIAVTEEMILVSTGSVRDEINASDVSGLLISIDRVSGFINWEIPLDGESWSGVYLQNDIAYLGTLSGSIYAIDISKSNNFLDDPSKRILWTYDSGRAIAGGILISGDSIIFGDFGNRIFKISNQARTEGLNFPSKSEWLFNTENWVWATPIEDEGIIYASTLSGYVYAIGRNNGEEKWSANLDSKIIASPIVFDRRRGDKIQRSLAVPSADENVYVLSLFDGKELGVFATESAVKSSPVIHNDLIYVHSVEGKLLWFSTVDMSFRGCTDLVERKPC